MTAAPRAARRGRGLARTTGNPLALGYKAFCLRNQDRYVQYARARSLEPGRARAVVESVLQALVEQWPRIMSGDRPASEAWKVLVSHVAAAARDTQVAPGGHGRDTVHRTLPGQQADIVLLRYRLSLSTAETADLMGLGVPEVTASLRRGMSILLNPA
ncbi:sigma factor-like helix-turn-helix DNA-binding protein [Streptomyces sp. NPDC057963]|uniref:sigma factor-like helix-turn-helix DNA-binding protein n=1 Tax=Streptomyces sp. NPDC057963 TaxID=3346290 RepID=UPI0036E231D0